MRELVLFFDFKPLAASDKAMDIIFIFVPMRDRDPDFTSGFLFF